MCSEGVDRGFWVESSNFIGSVAVFVLLVVVEEPGLVSEEDSRCWSQGSEVRVTRALPSVRNGTVSTPQVAKQSLWNEVGF